jgi:hypothetical protein
VTFRGDEREGAVSEIGPGVLEWLRRYDTATVCNLIELFDVRSHAVGYMDARIRACFPELPPMVGFAATATFRASEPPRGTDVYSSAEEQVELFKDLSGPPVLVFQDLDDPSVAATFGEVMCTIYQTFGAVGLITSGAGRDLDKVRALDFPVFTNATVCSHGYPHIPGCSGSRSRGRAPGAPRRPFARGPQRHHLDPTRDRVGTRRHRGRVRGRRGDRPRRAS